MNKFGHRGIYYDDMEKQLRCNCSHKWLKDYDTYGFLCHFKYDVHKMYERKREDQQIEQARMAPYVLAEKSQEEGRIALRNTRSTITVDVDDPFRKRAVQSFLSSGIALKKIDTLRPWLEAECRRSLTHSNHLTNKFVPKLIKEEKTIQRLEFMDDDYIGIIFDATPLQGDFFAMIGRHILLDPRLKRAIAGQVLIHGANVIGSLNQYTLAGEVTTGLMSIGLQHSNVAVAINDGCFTNGASHTAMADVSAVSEELHKKGVITTKGVPRFICLCISHCLNNAGDKARFVLLDYFWGLLQKVFSNSADAKAHWQDQTGMKWIEYSDNCWYAKYDVVEFISRYFPDLLLVIKAIITKGISPANATKLFSLLLDDMKCHQLKIELAAYVESLFNLRNL